MHRNGTKIALDDVFAEFQDDVYVFKGITSKNDVVSADSCEHTGLKLI